MRKNMRFESLGGRGLVLFEKKHFALQTLILFQLLCCLVVSRVKKYIVDLYFAHPNHEDH
jgi:hypothetical protein